MVFVVVVVAVAVVVCMNDCTVAKVGVLLDPIFGAFHMVYDQVLEVAEDTAVGVVFETKNCPVDQG